MVVIFSDVCIPIAAYYHPTLKSGGRGVTAINKEGWSFFNQKPVGPQRLSPGPLGPLGGYLSGGGGGGPLVEGSDEKGRYVFLVFFMFL